MQNAFVYFIEITLHLDNSLSDALDKMAVDGMNNVTTEELFDCVICGQTSTSTEGRPIGLVALLQPSAGVVAYSFYNIEGKITHF